MLAERLTDWFDRMYWKTSYTRTNVTGEKGKGCLSMHFGKVFRPFHGITDSSNNEQYMRVYQLLGQVSACLGFPCTTFTINKNLECKPHLDKQNRGDSLIFACGEFTGGEFIVDGQCRDIRLKPLAFNGATSVHGTKPFVGTRYSVVLYNIKYGDASGRDDASAPDDAAAPADASDQATK
jgi:hypothetical protein